MDVLSGIIVLFEILEPSFKTSISSVFPSSSLTVVSLIEDVLRGNVSALELLFSTILPSRLKPLSYETPIEELLLRLTDTLSATVADSLSTIRSKSPVELSAPEIEVTDIITSEINNIKINEFFNIFTSY